jgi:hypothetical protein
VFPCISCVATQDRRELLTRVVAAAIVRSHAMPGGTTPHRLSSAAASLNSPAPGRHTPILAVARTCWNGPVLSGTAAAAAASETVKGGAHIPSVPRRTRCRRVSKAKPAVPVPKPTLLPPHPPLPRRAFHAAYRPARGRGATAAASSSFPSPARPARRLGMVGSRRGRLFLSTWSVGWPSCDGERNPARARVRWLCRGSDREQQDLRRRRAARFC